VLRSPAALVVGLAAVLGACDPCGNKIFQTVPAPGGAMQAVVFERDCGATTGFGTDISIVPAGARLPGEPVFVADTDHGAAPAGPWGGPAVQVRWLAADHLEISHHPKARVFRSEARAGRVRVTYRSVAPR
jgi:hypothetical protein